MLTGKQQRLIEAALRDADRHGFALGGSAALLAHGLPGFSAKKIDLVTSRDQVRDAAKAVKKELRSAGYQPERTDTTAERRRVMFPPAPGLLAQWEVPTGGKHDHPRINGSTKYTCPKCWERLYLEISRAPRTREPVQTALGPVLHHEDAAGAKVRDLATRGLVRDYADVGRLLEHWSPQQLTGFARRQDPALDPRDLERTAARLAAKPDIALTWTNTVQPEHVPRLREQFANWQRDPRDITLTQPGRQRERPEPARETRQRPQAREHDRQEHARPPRAAQRDEPQLGR